MSRAPDDGLRIMIVDDSRAVVRELQPLLEAIPRVRVIATAADGESAVIAATRHLPDVIVLDVRMPRGNGFSVLKAVRQFSRPPAVLMLTNTAAPAVRRRALAAGATGFFDKTNEVAELIAEIKRRAQES